MKIGILGGTFDPPHNGHLALAEAAKETLGLDEVIFMPAFRNPLKTSGKSVPAKHRLEMVKLLVANRPGLAVSDSEVGRGGPSYAIDTINELQFVQPGEYWFIVGGDALKSLPEWKQPERLMKICRIAAAVRQPQDPADIIKRLPESYRDFIDIINMKPMDLSASDLRDKVARGQSITTWVPQAVAKYIETNKLYKLK
ncbi:MAG: nicotinate (nicotinamide) nucleotide adenylyltransferase [Armatimonadetes bacterium 55-13]|nr:nicotinate-nucleotide adenylyltransferase [Armatimonadota bacterium]OJU62407.1 MAG: nicotinate (nicotinamide) nucleotide adenylyltransferase [Armatimonadetes bacterium 55-13]